MHVSPNKANLNAINICTPHFHIWQHFDSKWTTVHIQKLVDVPKFPITQLYKYMIGVSEPILLFEMNRHIEEEPSLTWKLLAYPGAYIGTIGMTFLVGIGVYCLERFWCRPTCNTPQES